MRPHNAAAARDGKGPDFLHEEMRRRLAVADVVFDLAAQLFVDGKRTPIENGSVEWLEGVSPLGSLNRARKAVYLASARARDATLSVPSR